MFISWFFYFFSSFLHLFSYFLIDFSIFFLFFSPFLNFFPADTVVDSYKAVLQSSPFAATWRNTGAFFPFFPFHSSFTSINKKISLARVCSLFLEIKYRQSEVSSSLLSFVAVQPFTLTAPQILFTHASVPLCYKVVCHGV